MDAPDRLSFPAREPEQLALLSREGCAFCAQARKKLDAAGIDCVDVPLPHTIRSTALGAIAAAQTVPQLFANGQRIGGSAEIERTLRSLRLCVPCVQVISSAPRSL